MLVHTLEIIAVIFIMLIALLAWRLSTGPVPLTGLINYVRDVPLGNDDMAVRLDIQGADLIWETPSEGPLIRLSDAAVLPVAGGDAVARIPAIFVRVSLAALLRGQLAGSEIFMDRPSVTLTRTREESWSMGFSLTGTDDNTATPGAQTGLFFAALLGALSSEDTSVPASAYLDSVRIRDARLVLYDATTDSTLIAPGANLSFLRDPSGIRFSSDMALGEQGHIGRVSAAGVYAIAQDTMTSRLDLQTLKLGELDAFLPSLPGVDLSSTRLSGTVDARFSAQENATLKLTTAGISVTGGSVILGRELTKRTPVYVSDFRLTGQSYDDLDRLDVTELALIVGSPVKSATAPLVITADGGAAGLRSSPEISLNLRLEKLSVDELLAIWPNGWKPNTKSWLTKNLFDGSLHRTVAHIHLAGSDFSALNLNELEITSGLSGMTVRYLRGMPKVRDVFGVLSITPAEVTIEVGGGNIPDPVTGSGVELIDGVVRMYDLDQKLHLGDLDFNLQGDISEVLRVLNSERFRYADRMGLNPESVAGHTTALLSIDMPLLAQLTFDDITLKVAGQISDGLGVGTVAGRDLTDAELDIIVTGQGMDVSGTARIAGVPSGILWRENFSGGLFRSRYQVKAYVSPTDFPALFGVRADPAMMRGRARAEMVHTVARDRSAEMTVDLDLTAVEMAVAHMGWRKPDGLPARSTFRANFPADSGPITLSDAIFSSAAGDRLTANGSYHPENGWQTAQVSDLVLGRTRGRIVANREGDGNLDVRFDGPTLDLSGLITGAASAAMGGEEPAVHTSSMFNLTVDATQVFFDATGPAMQSLRAQLTQYGAHLHDLQASARLTPTATVDISMLPDGNLKAVHLRAGDAGRFLASTGVTGAVAGGGLEVIGDLTPEGFQGTAYMNRFIITQSPVTDKLLSEARRRGAQARLPTDAIIGIEAMELPLTVKDSVVRLSDGRAHGGNLGFTAQGYFALDSGAIDMRGTLIPAYGVNRALSGIPIFGTILSGGGDDGMFAATYTIRGDGARTSIQLNPVAALAPGFLRNIFTPFEPTAPQEKTVTNPG